MRIRLNDGKRPSRALILALDALFGVVLLGIALFGGGPSSSSPPAASGAAAAELTARLGNPTPPGQSTGFAVAPDGSLGLVDRGRQVIVRYGPDGQPRGEWGPSFGAGVTAQDMVGLAPDGDGWYVLDRGLNRIIRLDAQGQAQSARSIDLASLATYGPNGLAADGHGNLYMADTGRDRIVVFDASGHMTGSFGDSGSDLGKFHQPMFLAFGPDGSITVTDWENTRVERFAADHTPLNAWPVPAHAFGVAVDTLGRIFVPDPDHRIVRMFAPDGAVLAVFGSTDGGGVALPVDTPSQVAVSPDASTLWVLGVNGLARQDLAPFAGVRPSASPGVARLPLGVLGGLLLLLAGVFAVWPWLRRAGLAESVPTSLVRADLAWPRPAPSEPSPEAAPRSVPASNKRETPRGLVLADLALAPAAAASVGLALAALGLVGAMFSEMSVASPSARLDPWPRLAALFVASLVFAVGCGLSARALPWGWITEWPACAPALPSVRSHRLGLIGATVATVLALAAVVIWRQFGFQTPEATRGAYLWLAAVLIAIAVTAWYARPRLGPFSWWTLVPWALLLVALLPRAWDNANLPFGVWFDEAEGGLQARRFLQEGRFTPITDTYGRDASLYYYLMAASQALIKDPVLAQRLVSAIVGAACIPLMYLMGRELFGWRVGLAAALLLAVSRWHVDVSRLGWDPISLPFCAILAIWLLARAVRTERWTDCVWAGLAVGLGLHGYIGSRALPIVGLGMVVYAGWWLRWGPRKLGSAVGLVLAGAVLAALPVLVFAVQDPAGFNGRLNQTLILNEPVSVAQKLTEIWSNLQKHLLMFHVSGDMNGRHNLPGLPMLDVLSGLLVVLGLGVLLSRPFDWRSIVLVGWAVVSLLGGIMTFPFEAPQAMRTLGITPILAVLVALGLVLAIDRLRVFARSRFAAPVLGAAGALAVAWIGWTNLTTFFGAQMHDPTVWESFSTRETIPSRELLQAGRPIEAILGSPTIAPTLQQQLLVPELQRSIRPFDASSDLPYRGNGPAMVMLETEHEAGLADEVARYYPDATRRPIVPPNGNVPTVDELILEPDVLAAHRGLQQTPNGWRGLVAIDAPGTYAFRSPGASALTIDGASVTPSDRLQLARGNHVITLAGGPPTLEWQTPVASTWLPIDAGALYAAPEGGNGLQATFYPSLDFSSGPNEVIIDPVVAHYYHTNPLARLNLQPQTWSAEWLGSLDAPVDGSYRFEAERLSRAALWIDERPVFDDITSDAGTSAGLIQLTAGRHTIRMRLQDRGDGGPRMYLYWVPPGGGRQLVPGRVLYPPSPL